MCLAIPGTVTRIEEQDAIIDYGGTTRRASLRLLPDTAVGDCVLVHAGFVIQRVDPEDNAELESLLKEMDLL
ncbi:MAG: HypC/HybG/HupF family hydrogenase formation chaperone [Christensenella sp.]|nr:HypC/HybG/HupF family hydrogenase formation chaperone [Christensenella sp.]